MTALAKPKPEPLSPALQATAKLICQRLGTTTTHLVLQKLLYFCQMFHLGMHNEAVFPDDFQAWTYGPVQAELYHALKDEPDFIIPPETLAQFRGDLPAKSTKLVNAVSKVYGEKSIGELIALAHMKGGAWEGVYEPMRNNLIPKPLIKKDFEIALALEKQQKNVSR